MFQLSPSVSPEIWVIDSYWGSSSHARIHVQAGSGSTRIDHCNKKAPGSFWLCFPQQKNPGAVDLALKSSRSIPGRPKWTWAKALYPTKIWWVSYKNDQKSLPSGWLPLHLTILQRAKHRRPTKSCLGQWSNWKQVVFYHRKHQMMSFILWQVMTCGQLWSSRNVQQCCVSSWTSLKKWVVGLGFAWRPPSKKDIYAL